MCMDARYTVHMYMCVYIYIYIYVHMHACMHACMKVCIEICMFCRFASKSVKVGR